MSALFRLWQRPTAADALHGTHCNAACHVGVLDPRLRPLQRCVHAARPLPCTPIAPRALPMDAPICVASLSVACLSPSRHRRVAADSAKNYQLWNHRRKIAASRGPAAAADELAFADRALDLDEKNYHAWAHRQVRVCACICVCVFTGI
jgi:hypothetical protein